MFSQKILAVQNKNLKILCGNILFIANRFKLFSLKSSNPYTIPVFY